MDPNDLGTYAMTIMPDLTLGEFKYIETKQQFLSTRNDIVDTLTTSHLSGFGIRVLKDGAWGFSATHEMSKTAVDLTIERAIRLADAANFRNPDITLSDDPVIKDSVKSEYRLDPFEMEMEEKIDYFLRAADVAREYESIKFANGIYTAQRDLLVFFNTEGTQINQEITWNGGYMTLIGRGNGDTQTRKFHDDMFKTMGWELMKDLDFASNIDPVAKEVTDLLDTRQMKESKTSIILDPSQLGIQLHESCGHPTELDRVLGYEAAYAGTSFLKPEFLKDNFRYGNELVTINADATISQAIGSFPYDHEGVRGKNTQLVKNGRLAGFLTSRETAPLIGLNESGGTVRANSFDKIPLIRMTNIVLQPDDWTLEEMIAETKSGYYFHTNRSWSIDDLRNNFQFASEVAYRIEDGEIVELVKNPTYTGITPNFWNSVSAIADQDHMEVLGTPFCGKGEPGQSMYTGHGGPHTRFDNIRVGVID